PDGRPSGDGQRARPPLGGGLVAPGTRRAKRSKPVPGAGASNPTLEGARAAFTAPTKRARRRPSRGQGLDWCLALFVRAVIARSGDVLSFIDPPMAPVLMRVDGQDRKGRKGRKGLQGQFAIPSHSPCSPCSPFRS